MSQLLKISEFARLSGISRKNLIYYDEIGLLPPEQVLENGYRVYNYGQLETVVVIGVLKEVGMSLGEIKRHLDQRTPATLLTLFSTQLKTVQEKIRTLQRIETMIETRLSITQRALKIDPSEIELRECGAERLFAGAEIHSQDDAEAREEAIVAFYALCDGKKITYGYPFGTMVSQQNLLQGKWNFPLRFFYQLPKGEGRHPNISKPAGWYLTAFERSPYSGPHLVYGRLFRAMQQQGLVVQGNAYETFLLDEMAAQDPGDYLLQVSIQVGRR